MYSWEGPDSDNWFLVKIDTDVSVFKDILLPIFVSIKGDIVTPSIGSIFIGWETIE